MQHVRSKLMTISSATEDLRDAVAPDELEDVLSSLHFRRLISRFEVGQDVTRVTLRATRGISLVAALQVARGEEG